MNDEIDTEVDVEIYNEDEWETEYDVQKEVDHYNKLLEAHMKKEEYKQPKAEHKAQVQEMRDYLKEKSAANTSSDSSDS